MPSGGNYHRTKIWYFLPARGRRVKQPSGILFPGHSPTTFISIEISAQIALAFLRTLLFLRKLRERITHLLWWYSTKYINIQTRKII